MAWIARFRAFRSLTFVMVAILTGCSEAPHQSSSQSANPMFVDPESVDFSENPELLTRILDSPHGYLRFINVQFSQEVCRTYAETLAPYPDFNLHGDAHVEQYAVTDLGRGLTDFDDSSLGPSLVDISRFGVSLTLAAEMNGWESEDHRFIDRFLVGYRDALGDPRISAPKPVVASRLQQDFKYDREEYFRWIDEIAKPIPEHEERGLMEALGVYVEDIRARRPDLDERFFEVQRVGSLKLGIGSALDRKYLVQIRGESGGLDDDVVLELKAVRDLTGIECVSTGQSDDPYRILMGQSIAYQPYRLLGYVRFDEDTFWVHAWVDNYEELSIRRDLESPEELAEVAYDVGVQLGHGHPNQLRPPLDTQLRREQLRLLTRDSVAIRRTTRKLADQVRDAWEEFGLRHRAK